MEMRGNHFLSGLRLRVAKGPVRKILLPEADDKRIQQAAEILAREEGIQPKLIGATEVEEVRANELEKLLLELRASKKGTKDELSAERARELSHDPLFYATYLLSKGEADGVVAGASRESRDVIRAALWLVGKAEGIQTVSSAFYMVVPPFRGGGEEVLTFADCAVVPEPTAEQLADIAIASADARSKVVGDSPNVAFLSFSTKGSGGESGSIARVREAVRLVKERRPGIAVDGELQADAALVESIAKRKAGGSAVAGQANVLIFPSLDAGNIAYKLVAHLVPGARALGPILQGTKRPVSDLSRGATAEDIVETVLIIASQI